MIQYFPIVTGSLTVNGDLIVTGTGSMSSSNAVSSSYSYTASSAVNSFNAISSSYSYTASSAVNSFSASKAMSSSYADTASFANNFTVLGNLTVFGTQSVQYITSSQLNVSDNVITVNVASPGVRFGGLSVFDSGSLSSEATASLFWDSQNNHWIYQRESGSTYNGGMLISGPRNFAGLGNEQGTTSGSLMKGQGGDHITSSAIFEDGYKATFYNNSLVVSSSGFVGIGTSNPTGSLDVSGSVYIRSTGGGVLYIPRMADQSRGLSIGEQTSLGSKSAVIRTAGGVSEHLFLDPGFNNSNVAGNIALVYANTGSVGIGTYLPGAKLEIQSPRNSTLLRLTATSGENWDFKNTNTVGSTDVLSIGPAGATVNLSLKDDSSVGIGTTSPFSQLSLPSGTGWNGGLAWNYTSANSSSKRWWINTDQIAYGDFRICTEITQGGGSINSAGTLYERLYISNAGSVVLGLTSDFIGERLRVAGSTSANKPAMAITSANPNVSCPSGTATTVYTFPSYPRVMFYMVFVRFDTGADAPGYATYAIIAASSVGSKLMTVVNGTYATLTLSGLNVQINQTSGVTQNAVVSVIQIFAEAGSN